MKTTNLNRLLPPGIFVSVLLIGLAMTIFVYRAEQAADESRFIVLAEDAADRVRERVEQHIAFLQAAHSFFVVQNGLVSRDSFATFINGLELPNRLPGIQGIGFARLIEAGDEPAIASQLDDFYELDRAVWPEQTDQARRTPIVLLEPRDQRNTVALGFDMFSEPTRRAAMIGALAFDGPFASGPVELVQEITSDKQAGFLVYIPARVRPSATAPETVAGFVYAPFRAGDLHVAALRRAPGLPVVVETMDVTGSEPELLFRSPNFPEVAPSAEFAVDRSFDIAGRRWQMHIASTPQFGNRLPSLGILALGGISLLLAAALAASTRSQIRALEAAQQLHRNSEKNLKDKDLLLQEMKHRIKNSIARVLAIARQTAAHSKSLEDFSDSFMSRLQAMAGAQDMLTRSHWQRADLGELLRRELEQVFGEGTSGHSVSGESIDLSERATQALGLVFHELATNALKYGGIAEEGTALEISWRTEPRRAPDSLVIDWTERSGTPVEEPSETGFGTKLIDANVRSELGGRIERTFTPTGLTVRLTIPLAAIG